VNVKERKRIVYIAHPLNAPTPEGMEQNRRNAARWAAWAALTQNVSPVCDWVVLSSVLSEEHRELGLQCDLALIARVDEVWLVGGRVSSGMKIEADHAKLLGIPVRSFLLMGYEAPPLPGAETRSELPTLVEGHPTEGM
jgi:hypothetical protein